MSAISRTPTPTRGEAVKEDGSGIQFELFQLCRFKPVQWSYETGFQLITAAELHLYENTKAEEEKLDIHPRLTS